MAITDSIKKKLSFQSLYCCKRVMTVHITHVKWLYIIFILYTLCSGTYWQENYMILKLLAHLYGSSWSCVWSCFSLALISAWIQWQQQRVQTAEKSKCGSVTHSWSGQREASYSLPSKSLNLFQLETNLPTAVGHIASNYIGQGHKVKWMDLSSNRRIWKWFRLRWWICKVYWRRNSSPKYESNILRPNHLFVTLCVWKWYILLYGSEAILCNVSFLGFTIS